MDHFRNDLDSHYHSLETLTLLERYDSFLDSLKVICDMGCGTGRDAMWWAKLWTRDDPPEPRNYKVYAVDIKDRLLPEVKDTPNIIPVTGNFEEKLLPLKVDLMWSHDAFQYVLDPINTLRVWNEQMNKDGMLVVTLPQNISMMHNRPSHRAHSYSYYSHSIPGMLYLLAVSGFDCRDAYVKKVTNENWISFAVYKNGPPLDPRTTSLYDLVDQELLHPSAIASITNFGYMRQEDLVYPWLDKDWYQFRN